MGSLLMNSSTLTASVQDVLDTLVVSEHDDSIRDNNRPRLLSPKLLKTIYSGADVDASMGRCKGRRR
jgi:hypothetical protein